MTINNTQVAKELQLAERIAKDLEESNLSFERHLSLNTFADSSGFTWIEIPAEFRLDMFRRQPFVEMIIVHDDMTTEIIELETDLPVDNDDVRVCIALGRPGIK